MAITTNPGGGTLSGTTPVSAVAGVAMFSNLSIDKTGVSYVLTATSLGLTSAASTTFDITPGAANKLAFSVQPTSTVAGSSISSISVQVQDALGNLVTGSSASIALAIGTNAGGGTLSGTTPVSASGGVATFTNLSIDKTGTGYTLVASKLWDLASDTSAGFNITPAAAVKLAYAVQPSDTAAGSLISTVQVQVQDTFGNVVTSSSASIALAITTNPSGGILSGTTPVTAFGGVASFIDLSIDKTGTGYVLTATSLGLTSIASSGFNVIPGAPTQLVITAQPTNTQSVTNISAITVKVEDALGNVVTGSSASIAMAITTNPGSGTLSGTTPVSATSGVATFSDLQIDKVGTGYILTASSAGLTSAATNPFNITLGPATQLVFDVQPTDTWQTYPISQLPGSNRRRRRQPHRGRHA